MARITRTLDELLRFDRIAAMSKLAFLVFALLGALSTVAAQASAEPRDPQEPKPGLPSATPPVQGDPFVARIDDPKVDRDLLGGVEDRAPVRSAEENYYEAQAYNYLLVKAHKLPPDILTGNARRDLTFAHLFEEPDKYRGELIHIEGRLKRLRRFDAPKLAGKDGVPQLFEGWLFTDTSFNNPYCVIASELSPGVHVGEELDTRVKFDGYFFKRYRYKAAYGRFYDAPLLIGRELSPAGPASPPSEETSSFAHLLLPAFLGVLGTTAALAVGLTWWFRRGDRRVLAGLQRHRVVTFVEPDGTTGATEP
jgi:hypothetical protein